MQIINRYFPNLTDEQIYRFSKLKGLYEFWNEQINVISRKDIENLYERHILHSLSIAKFIEFKAGTTVIDVGTGGGFPGIPLAIIFPDVHFYLCDSIKRKIKVVTEVTENLGLKNVRIDQARSEQVQEQFDFVISRAVSRLSKFIPLVKKNIKKGGENKIANGIIYLKGGDFEEELAEIEKNAAITPISNYFEEEFFETKKIIYIPSLTK